VPLFTSSFPEEVKVGNLVGEMEKGAGKQKRRQVASIQRQEREGGRTHNIFWTLHANEGYTGKVQSEPINQRGKRRSPQWCSGEENRTYKCAAKQKEKSLTLPKG